MLMAGVLIENEPIRLTSSDGLPLQVRSFEILEDRVDSKSVIFDNGVEGDRRCRSAPLRVDLGDASATLCTLHFPERGFTTA